MKYLRIHTALWAIICLISVLFNAICYILYAFVRFLWCFQVEKWSDFNRCDNRWNNHWDGTYPIQKKYAANFLTAYKF